MKRAFYLSTIFFLAFGFISCKGDSNSSATSNPVPTATPTPAAKAEGSGELKAMPMEEIQKMYQLVDQIDYEFHTLPISMALSEKTGIQNNISYISPSVQWNIPDICKPLGKQLFYSKAELLYEANFYFDDNCRFLVFLQDGKPLYSNKFTPHGQKFYENVFQQVSGMKSQNQ